MNPGVSTAPAASVHVGVRAEVLGPARSVAGNGDPITVEDRPEPVSLAVNVALASPVHDHAGRGETVLHAHVLTNCR